MMHPGRMLKEPHEIIPLKIKTSLLVELESKDERVSLFCVAIQ
jgi:hypothetical protein